MGRSNGRRAGKGSGPLEPMAGIMIEVEITCICPRIKVQDLGLTLTKGDVVHVSHEQARLSKDLEVARMASGVVTRFVKRCENRRFEEDARPKAPPHRGPGRKLVEATRPDSAVVRGPVAFTGSPQEPVTVVLREELRALRHELVEAVQAAAQQSWGKPPSHDSVPSGAAPVLPVLPHSNPVFIPSNLVNTSVQMDITSTKSESESSGVEDAAAALKAARKKKS